MNQPLKASMGGNPESQEPTYRDASSYFEGMVSEAAKELNKQVRLQVSWAETAMSNSCLAMIFEPITHLIRNAVEHGIELPKERTAIGKPPVGMITLNAYQEGDCVVLNVKDDGRGLDASYLREKAIKDCMISSDCILSDYEIYQLIFQAGFSTVDQMVNQPPRGFGMNRALKGIESLNGYIDLHSMRREGVRFTIRVPFVDR